MKGLIAKIDGSAFRVGVEPWVSVVSPEGCAFGLIDLSFGFIEPPAMRRVMAVLDLPGGTLYMSRGIVLLNNLHCQ